MLWMYAAQLSNGFNSNFLSVACGHMGVYRYGLVWRTCVGVLVGVGATACDRVCSNLCLCVCARSPGALVPH